MVSDMQYGKAIYFGDSFDRTKPIVNLPEDCNRVKIIVRPRAPVTAFLQFKDRTEQWILSPFENGESNGRKIADSKEAWLFFKQA